MNSFQAFLTKLNLCHRLTIVAWIYCISFCLGLIPFFVSNDPSVQQPVHLFLTLPFGMFSGSLMIVGMLYLGYKLLYSCSDSSSPEDNEIKNPYDVEFAEPETRKAQDYANANPYDSDNESSDESWDTSIPEAKVI